MADDAGWADDPGPPVAEPTVRPGSTDRREAVWALKERIRRLEGLLDQRRAFFDEQYRRSTCYLTESVGDVVGFAVVRPDGYLSLLGVAPTHRRRGLGSRLLGRALVDHPALTCHVRATNGDAIGFYADHGLLVEERVPNYYRDGTDAYRLSRDPGLDGSVTDLFE